MENTAGASNKSTAVDETERFNRPDGLTPALEKEFESHSYSVEELANIPLRPHLLRFAVVGYAMCAIVSTIAFAGLALGLLFCGNFCSGVFAFVFFWVGLFVAIYAAVWLLPKSYEGLTSARMNWLSLGLFYSSPIGLFFGIFAVYQPLESFFGLHGKGVEGLMTALPVVCFGGAVPVTICALSLMAIMDKRSRSDLVEKFQVWRRWKEQREAEN